MTITCSHSPLPIGKGWSHIKLSNLLSLENQDQRAESKATTECPAGFQIPSSNRIVHSWLVQPSLRAELINKMRLHQQQNYLEERNPSWASSPASEAYFPYQEEACESINCRNGNSIDAGNLNFSNMLDFYWAAAMCLPRREPRISCWTALHNLPEPILYLEKLSHNRKFKTYW